MKKILFLTLLLLSSIIIFAQKSKNLPHEDSHKLIQAGLEAYENQQYEKAENLFRAVLFGDSLYYVAQYELALTKYVQEKYLEAAAILEEIPSYTTQIKYKQVLGLLANSYDLADSSEKAIVLYDKGIKMYPFAYNFYYEKGVALNNQKQYAEAEKMFRKSIFCSPTHQNSHYHLGLVLCQQKQFVPGILALNYCAMLNSTSNISLQALQLLAQLYANGLPNFSTLDDDEISDEAINKNRRYKPLEALINSNMALEKNFKKKSNIKHLLTSQNQLVFENIETDPASKAIEDMLYKPLFSSLVANKTTYNTFCYWLLQNTDVDNNKVKEKALKMGKVFKILSQEILSLLDKSISEGLEQPDNEMIYRYTDQYSLSSFGKANAMVHEEGEWTFIDNGITTQRLHVKNGVADGKCYEYDHLGNVSYEYNLKNFAISGECIHYFPQEQKIARKFFLENNRYNGNFEQYNYTGILIEKSTWKDGLYNGKVLQYYPKGTPKADAIFANGHYAGNSTFWYANGKIETSVKLNPDSTITITDYRTNGSIYSIHHKKDTLFVKAVAFYPTGEIEKEQLYDENGTLQSFRLYNKNGNASDIILYENGKKEGTESFFSPSGKKSVDFIRKNNKIVQVISYNNDGSIKEKINKTDGLFKVDFYIHDHDNISFLNTTGAFNEQGEKEGIHYQYSPQGVIIEKDVYSNGVLNGDCYQYYATGAIKEFAQMKDGALNGLHIEYYPNGHVKMETMYQNDMMTGVKYEYDLNGNMTAKYDFDENGNTVHLYDVCRNNILKKSNFIENTLISTESYDETGTRFAQHIFENGNGSNVSYHLNGKPHYITKITAGSITDTLFEYDINGKLINCFLYKEGFPDGDYKYFSEVTHDLTTSGQYSANELSGKAYLYNDGLKICERDYVANQRNGQEISYYGNGKIFTVCNCTYDKDDDCVAYSPDGKTTLWKTKYFDDIPYAISVMGRNGKMSDFQFIGNEQITFTSYYPNGVVSSKRVYENGKLTSSESFYPNGKICYEKKGEQGYTTVEKEYFENGTMYKEINWAFDEIQGVCRYYYPVGKLKREENWSSNKLDGEVKIYDPNGQLVETQIWYAGYRKQ